MVSAVSKPWAVVGDRRSLASRWEIAASQLVKYGGVVGGPMSESVLADMQAEIERLRPVPAWDQRLVDAQVDFKQEVTQHQRLRDEILKEQRGLERLRQTPEHMVLGIISPLMMQKPEETAAVVTRLFGPVRPRGYLNPGEAALPAFETADEYRDARRLMQAENEKLSDIKAGMRGVISYEVSDKPTQNRQLICALAERVWRLEARLRALEVIETTPATSNKRRAS
jgi:hypothetical protein